MKIILPVQVADDIEPQLPADVQVVHMTTEAEFTAATHDAEVLLRWWSPGRSTDDLLRQAPAVRWLHTPSAGVDHVLTPLVRERNIVLTNAAGVHGVPIAEFVLAFMLNHVKGMAALQAAQAEARWLDRHSCRELTDAVLLIIGIGGIGQEIAKRAAAFGMRVWGSRRTAQPMPGVERVVGGAEWRTLLPEADFVVIATPLTAETRHMIDAAALRAMKSTTYLINIARGAIIDDNALLTALRAGWIAGAALDTFDPEPLPADHPYWTAPNVTITPHTTASTPLFRRRSAELFLDNLARYRDGRPLRNVVDFDAGY